MKFFKTIIAVWLLIFFCHAAYGATLRWDASTGADGYTLYFNGFTYNATETEVVDIDTTLNLHPATTYTFTVTAYNQMGESDHSNSIQYTTADGYTPPDNQLPITVTRPTTITITIE